MPVNKVIYGGSTLIDLSADTVTADKLLAGYTAHDKSGTQITGTGTAGGGGGLPSPIVAGNTPVLGSWTGQKVSATTATETSLTLTITQAGTYRFRIPCLTSSSYSMGGSPTVYLYKNGAQAASNMVSTSVVSALSFDLACAAGDVITVYAAGVGSSYMTTAVTVLALIACVDWDNQF